MDRYIFDYWISEINISILAANDYADYEEELAAFQYICDVAKRHLFSKPTIPKTAPHAPNNEASKLAAKKIQPRLTGIRKAVLERIKSSNGLTGSEIAKDLNILLYTAKPRCTELRDAGYIKEIGTRMNRNGSMETIWIYNGEKA